ncbi:MAG TPA: biopolymer transporter ExbD [Thioalkalivibrio sp.]|nr:biopolymer transporter ExbD [Thioalkalivibrio sp.]
MKRMSRAQRHRAVALNLTSLMDVFTILVLYLLVNQSAVEIIDPPKDITLPESVAEAAPRQTVMLMVSEEYVLVQSEPVMTVAELLEGDGRVAEPVKDSLARLKDRVIGLTTEAVAQGDEVTIMAHRTIPFKALKTLMATATSAGYTKISLAVTQKASQN